ncbi:MAG: cysteine rich repeat-containing protein [Desulfobacteraceae bacterium]|nr:cysteine rich repeat-containing protein [Desulfobacteraceae bacterium]MDH3722078.1 cysteine rich repeat-containing protein [Desulfobacteraceae bacterium]MDH3837710.1 cysteine rich repeat-containing protein [Desulfobacteraceae bacterium]MDH3874946.1 cysteine rich repeat-containing protein [Desulfobacteraceae bacterium]
MKRMMIFFVALAILLMGITSANAQQGLVETVANGCKVEIEKYCSQVTPGEGRVLACLYAHEDKLSSKCEYALYDAAAQLERAVAALSYVANECDADLEKYCKSIAPGEGRLLDCLEKHDKQVSGRCKQALKAVGLK